MNTPHVDTGIKAAAARAIRRVKEPSAIKREEDEEFMPGGKEIEIRANNNIAKQTQVQLPKRLSSCKIFATQDHANLLHRPCL
jgi:hypothetical protein